MKNPADSDRIVFLSRDGCFNTPEMKKNLDDAIKQLSLDGYTAIDVGDLPESDPRTSYGTPTLLVDGVDIMGMPVSTQAGSPG